LLLLPPYLVEGPQRGLVDYVSEVAAATALPVIVYSRDNGVFDPASLDELTAIDNVMGYKDGAGDLESIGRARVIADRSAALLAKDFLFFNGMPAAETTVRSYAAAGVELYSSSAFSFAPEISTAFYRAFHDGDIAVADRLLERFFYPLAAVRSRVPGYGVSLIKAGLRLRGIDAGSVRAPLVDPAPEDLERMRDILDAGLALVEELESAAAVPVGS
jgi:5-dehydro-4-deoxyglucarate dehydratase